MATDHNFKVKNGLTVQGETLVVNHTGDLSGTQVYIKRLDGNNNLQRWGEGTSGQSTYRFRIDQDFKFIGNSGSGDKIILDSSTGNIRGTTFNAGSTQIIDSSRNLANIGTISSGTITSSGNINASSGHINTANQYLNGAIRVLNSAGDGWNVFANRTSAGIFDLSSIGTLSTSGNITTSGTITSTGTSNSSLYAITLSRSGSGTTTPDIWGTNGTFVIGTSSTDEVLGMSGSNATFYGNLSVTGNLTVSGTQTTLNTTTLQVEDKNIVLNYGTGDTSSSANGAGITIQDAVNSSTDATITWSQAGGNFNVSHGWNSLGYLQHSGVLYSRDNLAVLNSAGNGWNTWATRSGGQFNLSVGTISSGSITASGSVNLGTTTDGSRRFKWYNDNNHSLYYDSDLLTTESADVFTYWENVVFRHRDSTNAVTISGSSGDISAGAITSTGKVSIDASTSTSSQSSLKLHVGTINSTSSSAIAQFGGFIRASQYYILHASAGSADSLFIDYVGDDMDITQGEGNYNGGLRANAYRIGSNGTTVIDSSRNLLNIGTISSGAITANGGGNQSVIKSSSDAPLIVESTDAYSGINFKDTGGNSSMFYHGATDHLYLNSAKFSVAGSTLASGYQFQVNGSANLIGALSIGGAAVINSSRGLTNITSGHIAGNLTIDYTGNGTNDAGIAVFNDNNDWGIKIDKDGSATYGLKISADGNYPFYVTNAAGTEIFRIISGGATQQLGNATIGNSSTAAAYKAHYNDGSYMELHGFGLVMARTGSYIRPSTNGDKDLYIGGADDSLDWRSIYIRSDNGLSLNGSNFIDASRNLNNIGTISSGSITSSGTVITGGDLTIGGTGGIFTPEYVYHVGDTNTYFGFNANDSWRVVTGAEERIKANNGEVVINDNSADMNFRVESNGNANMLYVDGGNNSVTVGSAISNSGVPFLVDYNNTSKFMVGGVQGGISNNVFYNGSTWSTINSSAGGGILQISTDGSFNFRRGTAASTPTMTYSMTIDGSGNLLLGQTTTTTPGSGNTTAGASIRAGGSSFFAVSQGPAQYLSRYSNEGAFLVFRYNNAEVGTIGVSGGNNLYITGTQTNHAGLTFATDSVLPTRQSSVTNGVTDLGQNGNTFRHIWMGDQGVLYFGDANHYIFGGASLSGGDMRIRASDDISLFSRWVRYHDDTGSAGEYARIAYNGSWINSNLSVNGNIKIGASGGGTTIIDTSRNLVNIGTISSGAITSTGNMSLTGSLDITKSGSSHSLVLGTLDDLVNPSADAYIWVTSGVGSVGTFKYGQGAHLVFEGRRSARNFYFKVGDVTAPQHIMHSNGYVGFGTGDITPTDRVHVDGTVRASSYKIGTTEVINSSGQFTGGISLSSLSIGGTTVIDSSRNLTNINLVKFRENSASFYISPTNPNTLNAQYGITADDADMWINYRGYADGFTKFRDFRIGNGKGTALLFVDGSSKAFDFQSGSFIQIGGTTVIDASRNLTNIGTISSGAITSSGTVTGGSLSTSGNAIIGTNLYFGGATNGSLIQQASTNLNYMADGANIFKTYSGSWGERARIDDNGLTMASSKGISSDGTGRQYNWRALANSSSSAGYVKIARVYGSQSVRFVIELAGRSNSYGDGSLGALGYIVGQLNNDNNYDIVYYNHLIGSSEVVSEVGQVDVDNNQTDIYVQVGNFAELSAHAHISHGYITTHNTLSTSQPTGYTAANSEARVFNSKTNITMDSGTSLVHNGTTVIDSSRNGTFAGLTVSGSTVWHAGNDGPGSGLDADTVDGIQAASTLHKLNNTGYYRPNTWIDFRDSGTAGLYWGAGNAAGWHLYPLNTGQFLLRSGRTDYCQVDLAAGNDTRRGSIYADSSSNVGFLDDSGQWAIRHINHSGTEFRQANTVIAAIGAGQVSGSFGSMVVKDTKGGYGGYSINNRVVFMHNNANTSGIYNDVNNHWMVRTENGGEVILYNNGSQKFQTTGDGILVGGMLRGGIGASTTGGTGDWNHSTNARSGQGHTLLFGDHTNGPHSGQSGKYYHPFSFEYNSKDGTGNLCQFAIPYAHNDFGPYFRTRYSGTWSGWVELWHSGNDGAGSGLDADTLDGLNSSSFLRKDTSDTINGILTIGGTAAGSEGGELRFTFGSSTTLSGSTVNNDLAGNTVRWFESGGNTRGAYIDINTCGNGASSKIWHSTNDGTGSGLDADLLDGQHGSYYYSSANYPPRTSFEDTHNNLSSNTGSGANLNSTFTGAAKSGNFDVWSGSNMPPSTTHVQGVQVRHSTTTHYGWQLASQYNQPGKMYLRNVSNSTFFDWHTMWSSANDGSGSGLDADLLDGQHASAFLGVSAKAADSNLLDGLDLHTGRNNEVNKVVRTDSNGYINAGWINTTSGDIGTSIPSRIYTNDAGSGDAYVRYADLATFRSLMNVTAKTGYQGREQSTSNTDYWVGTMGWSSNDMNDIFNYGSGSIDAWSTPNNAPSGTSHWVGSQHLHYTNVTNAYGHQIVVGAGNPSLMYVRGRWGATSTWSSWVKIWNASNDGSGSGLDADTLDGYHSAETGSNVNLRTGSNGYLYLNNWLRTGNSTGIYTSDGAYFYRQGAYWGSRGNSANSSGTQYQTSEGTTRGYVYANNSNDIGFLNEASAWRIRVQSAGSVYMGGTQQMRINSSSTTGILESTATNMVLRSSGGGAISFQKSGGTVLAEYTNAGHYSNVDGHTTLKRTNGAPLILDRLGTGGNGGTSRDEILNFRSNGTKVGEIGYQNPYGGILYMAHGSTSGFGIGFYAFSTSLYIQPCDQNGAIKDNAVDIGSSGSRFDDVYATNGTIQTSDINEKQDIQALTTAEQAAAVACKALVRRFRWIDSVEEKGDDARYHFGVIAQDVEAAFTAQGLDAGRYGLFIRTNWWEHENTWYPSEEAAPEGAVEKTRLGIRYNQLLAFIISAL